MCRIVGALLPALVAACAPVEPAAEPAAQCLRGLVFADATLSAGSTDYGFTSPTGARVTFRVENGVTKAKGFDAFLGPAVDGPAETEPAMVGRVFAVCQEDGILTATEQDPPAG